MRFFFSIALVGSAIYASAIDWQERALDVARLLSIDPGSAALEVSIVGDLVMVENSDLTVAFSKTVGELISITDDAYDISRVMERKTRLPRDPGQGYRFTSDAEWARHGERFVQKLWPSTTLKPYHKIEKTGERGSKRSRSWSSSSNLVRVIWYTEPYNGYQREVNVIVDQQSGRFVSASRGRPWPLRRS